MTLWLLGNEKMKNTKNNHALVLRALTYVLVDIRATTNLKKANTLANVFHNVPNLISRKQNRSEIISEIFAIAERLNCRSTIEGYFIAAAAYTGEDWPLESSV